jgi:hypothetical protein
MEDDKTKNTRKTEEKVRREQPVESGVSERAPLEDQQMTAQILLGGYQAAGLIDAGGVNPFRRRDSIARTHSKSRTSSASSICLDYLEQTEEGKSEVS